ncbi:CehA/McbA family metallohydrolase [Planctomycetaceae bacterium SH139]
MLSNTSFQKLGLSLISIPVFMVTLAIQAARCDILAAHEGHTHAQAERRESPAKSSVETEEAGQYFQLFTSLIAQWPSAMTEQLISQATEEHRFLHNDPKAISLEDLREQRLKTLSQLRQQLPSISVDWADAPVLRPTSIAPIVACRSIATPLLVTLGNGSKTDLLLSVQPNGREVRIKADSEITFLCEVLVDASTGVSNHVSIPLAKAPGEDLERSVEVPVKVAQAAVVRGTIRDGKAIIPARVTVLCSDGVYRYGGEFSNKSTFTDKPIIYPPIGTWRRNSFFYSDGTFEIEVPPGATRITLERGFEHEPQTIDTRLDAGQTIEVELACQQMIDMSALGWISGDTHVHWVTNAWNVDEPLSLLSMVQKAEDLRVVNNLTLLQRYADQAFIKPSQAPMGPISQFSNSRFHLQMGEEYRNEDLYGHLCFLNIDWLVQPIGTGSIIAGPDALDYPLNRTAIDDCRAQGGISIEAHGTGGNKDVPVNVIHNLVDSLDQLEPEMYYRLLDCGFRLPLTNGSDHPARNLGIARAYVKVDGSFTYDRWIEGIRRGRTFTSSGPLIFLDVNTSSIGDVIQSGSEETLHIQAKVISRHPIGKFQIVSNGQIIAERMIDETSAELKLSIPANESRWIVARCSNRTDGLSEFGFGDFNAITGPGIAHTSPVYVHVDGQPRFDASAAKYWADRMRAHVLDIGSRGRFASDEQRDEAINYIEQGIAMFNALEQQIQTARQRDESLDEAKDRLANVVRRFGNTSEIKAALKALAASETRRALDEALSPLTLLSASVNPESRIKISSRTDRIELLQGRPQRFLIQLENTAGTTAPLGLTAIDIASAPPQAADWFDIRVIDSPFSSVHCTGAEHEFKVIEVLMRESGLREVRLVADVGQGTQDLGFRATTDLMIDTKPRRTTNTTTATNGR